MGDGSLIMKRKRFHLRLSDADYLLLKRRARARSMHMSDYVRFLVRKDEGI